MVWGGKNWRQSDSLGPCLPNHCSHASSALSGDIRESAKRKFRGFCADLGAVVGTWMLVEVDGDVSAGAPSDRKWPLLNAKETRPLHRNIIKRQSVIYLRGLNGCGMSLSTMRIELETVCRWIQAIFPEFSVAVDLHDGLIRTRQGVATNLIVRTYRTIEISN